MEDKMVPTLHAAATPADAPADSPMATGANDPDSPLIDSESAALLRCWVQPIIARAASWHALDSALALHGYALVFRRGRLCLAHRQNGACICSMRYLGTSLKELSARLGRPAVRPLPGQPAAGVLCARPQG